VKPNVVKTRNIDEKLNRNLFMVIF